MPAVEEQWRPFAEVADDIGVLMALLDHASTRQDCTALREDVLTLAAAVQSAAKGRTRAVAQLEEAAIHLGRAAVHVPLVTGCRLASAALAAAFGDIAVVPGATA